MKKLFFGFSLLLLSFNFINAQDNITNEEYPSIAQKLNIVQKKSDKLNIYLNTHTTFDLADNGSNNWSAKFRMKDIRFEAKGYLTDKLFYRLRHKLNQRNEKGSLDGLSKATDILKVGYHFNDKITVIGGKLIQYWGGWEYDLNPIYIYEFSDYGENMDCFQLGAAVIYTPNKDHEFVFQITDNHNDKFEDFYSNYYLPEGIEESKMPLTYIFNWNGNLFSDVIKTRWAVALQTDAKDKHTYSITLGTMLNLPNFQLAFDYMRDDSDLDRLLVASNDAKDYFMSTNTPVNIFEDVTYNSFIAKAEYQPSSSWNLFVKGIYETANVAELEYIDDNFRKSYGYYAGIEYMPFEDQEMRLFLTYLGKKVKFEGNTNLFSNYDKNRISLGVIYRIKAF
ncbi:phosphate-selective porin O/P [Balneicella halophila]|uniref:Phosphate-selective porin O/P n=1 Tax=Balneicella halophila TaxID=1537566 RepID=A0A7L4UTJ5_BALHA|nr:porin [Balneicella halophila]PVX52514.1 phosphate-selective porin O/P [Balneicella halophila]